MRMILIATLLLAPASQVLAQGDAPEVELKTPQQRASYAIGQNIASNLSQQGLEVDAAALLAGLEDALKERDSRLTDEQIAAAMRAYQRELRDAQARRRIEADPELKALAAKNQAEGKKFLAENKERTNVKTTKSGLQYEVLAKGDSDRSPKSTDRVTTHYHGTLIDGTVFDSSVKRDEPATFRVDQVIDGWTEALQMMHVGDKWKLYIPADLAYGLSPRPGGPIGPNAVLVFEVQLLEIVE